MLAALAMLATDSVLRCGELRRDGFSVDWESLPDGESCRTVGGRKSGFRSNGLPPNEGICGVFGEACCEKLLDALNGCEATGRPSN
jgi:hypothetical protein